MRGLSKWNRVVVRVAWAVGILWYGMTAMAGTIPA
ncbi:hypothetical protein JOF56_000394 [Kibdelosporangium banguiense]|uniref:Uncharacterized protein n=1 Tax=Kibdelosporangium banguiense TaxID=1365924 RepID=A0ABS4T6G0_9PSEU|nr:hypothetical protein [Kibdelosporangium banguiense]